jgi:hypothetical protein
VLEPIAGAVSPTATAAGFNRRLQSLTHPTASAPGAAPSSSLHTILHLYARPFPSTTAVRHAHSPGSVLYKSMVLAA